MVPDLRPRGIGEILDAAAALYRARFGELIRYAAIVVIPVQFLLTLVLISAQPDRFSVNGISGSASPQFDSGNAQLGATVVILVVSLLTHALIVAITTRIVANQYVGHDEAARRLLGTAGRRFFAVIGVSLLVAICQGLGLIFCFVGIVVPMALFSVAIPALLLERKSVGGALSRSIQLAKPHFWHAAGVVLAASLLGALLNAALSGALNLFAHGSSTTTIAIAQCVANSIAAVFTTPFVAAATVALYFDLRIRTEAFDVQMAISRPPSAP
jgi:hypothetical protein